MHRKKHKRKVRRVVIFTSDAVDAKVKQWRLRPWLINVMLLLVCILVGGIIGYFTYEGQIWAGIQETLDQKDKDIAALQEENESLVLEVDTLTAKITLLSDTVNQKAQDADELENQLAEQSMPTASPLTGSARTEEISEGEPMCIFTGKEDSTVVATATGTVLSVEDDETYGHRITIDHGNGYMTVYRNKGDAKVRAGDSVARGTTLYIVGEDNLQLCYQVLRDGVYIDPLEMLDVSG